MDFSSRNTQQTQSTHPGAPLGASGPSAPSKLTDNKGVKKRFAGKWLRIGAVALLFCLTILVAAVVALLAIGSPNQGKYVNSKVYQAVFLTNGQVYFGHLKNVNSSYLDLTNIYYLQSSNSNSSTASPSTANNNVTLIKLGCELHAPYDQMIINASQVSFWENIQSNGQVAQGIAKLPKCTQQSSSTNQSTSTAPSNSTPTTPSTSTTTKP